MVPWRCAIGSCDSVFDDVESAILHQAKEHERCKCQVCGTLVPDGYFAIRHAFDEHTRAEYVRAYGASADDVRLREEVKNEIEETADMQYVVSQLKRDPTEVG